MVGTIISGALALLGVALGALLGARDTGNQWLKEKQLAAAQALMDCYAKLYEQMAFSRRGQVLDLSWAAWNQALTSVSFVCDAPVVDAAYHLDEQLWRADWAIRGWKTGQDAWIKPVDRARVDLVHAIRRQTSDRFREPVWSSGRPPDDDPMWKDSPSTE